MEPAADRKPRLLMVEDNPGDVELFRWALNRAQLDCELSVIRDGEEALDWVRRESAAPTTGPPDLVLLDLNLPKVDGREILTAIRSTEALAHVPVVILTSSNSQREREQLKDLQVSRYLVKPPDLNEFLNIGLVVKELLQELMEKGRNAEAP